MSCNLLPGLYKSSNMRFVSPIYDWSNQGTYDGLGIQLGWENRNFDRETCFKTPNWKPEKEMRGCCKYMN
jgi:hypothetical protein